MVIDAYAPCPCGSGKKFKWCCQPFYGQIEKAIRQHNNRQFDSALETMEQLTKEHPDNAEVWGRRAELLFYNEKLEEAEASIDKALEINPNYAFGHYLRGIFRHNEGEGVGALVLYRKAMDVCSEEQRSLLANVAIAMAQCHFSMQRPLAAHATLEIAHQYAPQDTNVQELRQTYFGERSPYPLLARRDYSFQAPPKSASAEKRQAWEKALGHRTTGKLTDAAKAFEELSAADDQDAAAWYNLGLVRAWLGDDAKALEALDRYVGLETDEDAAAEAWALAEVVRFAQGMEEASDFLQHQVSYTIRDGQTVGKMLTNEKRISDPVQQEGRIGATLLDREMPAASDDLPAFETPRVAALLLIIHDQLMLLNTDETMLEKARQILEPQLAGAVSAPESRTGNAPFAELVQRILPIRLPAGLSNAAAKRLIEGSLHQWFEETWTHMPLKSLGHISPLDAVGHAVLRRKVLGLIRFWEDLTRAALPLYDFDRLRHKLNLPTSKPVSAAAISAPTDIGAMNAAELASLNVDAASDADLQLAFQTALRLDARELAGRFAERAAARPAPDGISDRFALYNHLLSQAMDNDDAAAAQSWVDAGLKYDCEHNEGRRRNDYEMRRAQVHLRAKEPDKAMEVFDSVIQRVPSNLDLIGRATEAMLGAKQPKHAGKFAEQGLSKAKERGERDRVGYFEELLAAARKG